MDKQQISKIILKKLRMSLTELLEKEGFSYTIKANRTGKFIEDVWIKNKGWQSSELKMLFNPVLNNINMAFSVFLEAGKNNRMLFEGAMLDDLMKKNCAYRLPAKMFGLFLNKRTERFIAIISRDISNNLCWFENYNNPVDCLNILMNEKLENTQKRSGFGKSETDKAIRFLNSIK
jgi:hypothetical protein